MLLAPGQEFAGFRIIRKLADGGMGVVYVAEHLRTGHERALKLLRADVKELDAKASERFQREARVGSRIKSDHLVEVVDAGHEAGTLWIAMELLEGETLEEHIQRRGPLTRQETVAVFTQLGHGLERAHYQGLVHRDLKPENIFLELARRADVAFTVKILDFGIALVVRTTSEVTKSKVGTPLWMAPEQIEGKGIRPACDVFSLGLIAFYVLTGKIYWVNAHREDSSLQSLFYEIVMTDRERASVRNDDLGGSTTLPKGFDDWLERCLQYDPEDRFPDAGSAIRMLLGILHAPFDEVVQRSSFPPTWDSSLAASLERNPPDAARAEVEPVSEDYASVVVPPDEAPAIQPEEAPAFQPLEAAPVFQPSEEALAFQPSEETVIAEERTSDAPGWEDPSLAEGGSQTFEAERDSLDADTEKSDLPNERDLALTSEHEFLFDSEEEPGPAGDTSAEQEVESGTTSESDAATDGREPDNDDEWQDDEEEEAARVAASRARLRTTTNPSVTARSTAPSRATPASSWLSVVGAVAIVLLAVVAVMVQSGPSPLPSKPAVSVAAPAPRSKATVVGASARAASSRSTNSLDRESPSEGQRDANEGEGAPEDEVPEPPQTKAERRSARRGDPRNEFDRGSATYALAMAAVRAANACKIPGGPGGPGAASVTFDTDGTVRSTVVLGNNYEGTSIEGCVASHFEKAQVPPFKGPPVTMTQRFDIKGVSSEQPGKNPYVPEKNPTAAPNEEPRPGQPLPRQWKERPGF